MARDLNDDFVFEKSELRMSSYQLEVICVPNGLNPWRLLIESRLVFSVTFLSNLILSNSIFFLVSWLSLKFLGAVKIPMSSGTLVSFELTALLAV